jgi:hypothetical protein
MLQCNDREGSLPAQAVCGKEGEGGLSWRVAVLPYLGEAALYEQFWLDEPWDGPHNHALLGRMPAVHAPPARQGAKSSGLTFYQVFVGKETPFNGKVRAKIPSDFPDGTMNTILIAEAGEPVPWTKPQDLPYDRHKSVPKVGGLFSSHFNFVLADGTARSYPIPFPNELTVRALITPAGGEAGEGDW